MNKSIILLALLFACCAAANIRTAHRTDEWTKIDVNNLTDREKSIDDFIRGSLSSLSG